MNSHDLTDDELIPFLHNLGVETFNKSFEWMLNDAEFASVLRWLYNNLDHNNALTAREEFRYIEIEKRGALLTSEELESTINSIQEEYAGICLPGDKESLEEVKFDVNSQKEKIQMLAEDEIMIKNMISRNEAFKDSLNVELSKLGMVETESSDDLSSSAEECQVLAEEVENITDEVINIIANKLDVYSNCHVDKEIAKNFLIFGPLDAYRQTQALFKSHFDLYTTKQFGKQNDNLSDEDLRSVLLEAKNMEERLSNAMYAYVDSKVDLSCEQAKLALVSNYAAVHPSQATSLSVEAQTAKELLAQEEAILMQQIQDAIQELMASRTRLAVDVATKCTLAVREHLLASVEHLLCTSQHALASDRVLCCALRRELRAAEQCAQFAAQLAQHVAGERAAVAARVAAMNEITLEQEAAYKACVSAEPVLTILYTALGMPVSNDPVPLVKIYADLQSKVEELNVQADDRFRRRKTALEDFKTSMKPLKDYIYDGCTKQPNCLDRTVASLSHALKQDMERVDKRVVEVGSLFTSVKTGDRHNLRKLWQWFLTDKQKLQAAVKGIQGISTR